MHWKGKDMQDMWSYMENSCFWQLCSQRSNRGTQSEESSPKYWKDVKKRVMGSPGNCFRKGKSLSSAEILYILSPTDKIATVFWALTPHPQSRARSLSHPNEKTEKKQELLFCNYLSSIFQKVLYCIVHHVPVTNSEQKGSDNSDWRFLFSSFS